MKKHLTLVLCCLALWTSSLAQVWELESTQKTEIVLLSHQKEDYISLTDMAKFKNPEATGLVISHWLSTRYTIRFMGIWEQINNPNFNVTKFGNIKNESGDNGFVLTSMLHLKMPLLHEVKMLKCL